MKHPVLAALLATIVASAALATGEEAAPASALAESFWTSAVSPREGTRVGVFVHYRTGSTRWDLSGFRVDGRFKGDLGSVGAGITVDHPRGKIFRYVVSAGYDHQDTDLDAGSNDPELHVRMRKIFSDHEFDFDVVQRERFRLSVGPSIGLDIQHGKADGWRSAGGFGEVRGSQGVTLVDGVCGGQIAAGFVASTGLEIVVTGGLRYSATLYDKLGAGPLDEVDVSNRAAFLRAAFLFGHRSR